MLKNRFFLMFYFLIIVCTQTCPAEPLSEKIDKIALKAGFSGTIAAKQNNNILLVKSYGCCQIEDSLPCKDTTIYRIASLSKQFTAAAILQLKEQGLLDLNDPIIKYLPDYPKEVASKVTIHHLLSNSSGIPEYIHNPVPLETILGGLPLKDLIAQFKDCPLEFEPGEKYNYSNSGFVLLGAIIEKVSGMSYGDYLQKNIFDKLSLKTIRYRPNSRGCNEAIGYSQNADGQIVKAPNIHNSLAFSTGGLISDVYDLLKWDEALNNYKVVSKESVELMKGNQIQREKDPNCFYGYGLEVDIGDNKKCFHFGSMPGFRSMMSKHEKEDLCIVILSNHDFSKELIIEIENSIYENYKKKTD